MTLLQTVFNIDLPIIQAPMAGIQTSAMAVALQSHRCAQRQKSSEAAIFHRCGRARMRADAKRWVLLMSRVNWRL